MMVINVVVKTIIYLFITDLLQEFVSGAWLKLFFEALCFGLDQTSKKVFISRRPCLHFLQHNFKQHRANLSMKYATA